MPRATAIARVGEFESEIPPHGEPAIGTASKARATHGNRLIQ